MDWSKWESVTCEGEEASLSVAHLPGVPPVSLPRRCFPSHHIWRKRRLMASPSLTGTVVDLEIPSRPGDKEAGSLSGLGVLITSAELPSVRHLVAPHRHLGMFALTSLPLLPGPLGFRNIKSHDSPLAFHLFPGGSQVGYPNTPRLALPLSLLPGPRLVHEQQTPVLCPCSAKVQANSYVVPPPPTFFFLQTPGFHGRGQIPFYHVSPPGSISQAFLEASPCALQRKEDAHLPTQKLKAHSPSAGV